MPQIKITTTESNQVWASPDGKIKIYEVTVETADGEAIVNTYSEAIAKVGFEGEVESYEKPGKNGSQTFIKQVQKEGGYAGGGNYRGGGGKPQADQFTMYLSYAKDIVVALVEKGEYSDEKFTELLSAVSAGGEQLYNARPTAEQAKPAVDKPEEKAINKEEEVDDAQTTIDNIFGEPDKPAKTTKRNLGD